MNPLRFASIPFEALRESAREASEPLVRRHLNLVVGRMISPLSLAVICVCVIAGAGAFTVGTGGADTAIAVINLVLALCFSGLYTWVRHKGAPSENAHLVGSSFTLVIAVAIAVEIVVSRSAWHSAYSSLLFPCLGCFLLSYRWWLITTPVAYAVWEIGIALGEDPVLSDGFRLIIYASIVVSFAIHHVRLVSYCRMVRLDLENQKQKDDLESAIRTLEESEERFGRFTNASSEGVIFIGDGRIVDTNEVFLQMSGLSREEAVGDDVAKRFSLENCEVDFREIRPTVDGWRRGMELHSKSGTMVPVSVYCRTMSLGGESILAASIRDLTEQRAREQELSKANASEKAARSRAEALAESANAASVAKSEFLANMSHEIRTPLNGVIGMTNMLFESGLKDTQMEFAEMIRRSAESLLVIVNDVLDFSQIEAGKLRIYSQPFILQDEILHAVQPLSQMAQSKGVELEVMVEQPVQTEVVGDRTRICQIVTNLVGNAVKFTQDGSVVVFMRAQPEGQGKVRLRCEVRDTGVGIDPASRPKLFQSFSQADASSTRHFGGTGLGLAISRQLVELMNGEIGVESEKGIGSSFWFTLPLKTGKTDSASNLAPGNRYVVLVNINETTSRAIMHYASELKVDLIVVASISEIVSAMRTVPGVHEGQLLILTEAVLDADESAEVRDPVRAAFPEIEVRLAIVADYLTRTKLQERSGDSSLPTLPKPVRKQRLMELLDFSTALEDADGPPVPASLRSASADAIAINGIEGLSVLVAEDDDANRKIIEHKLAALEMNADFARDGRTAIDAFGLGGHDIVLLDSQMPGVDGGEAAKSMREFQSRISFLKDPAQRPVCPVGIVAITVDDVAADSELARQMDHRLAKPFRTSELKAVLERRLAQRVEFDRLVKGRSLLSTAVIRDLKMLADGNVSIIREVLDSFLKVSRENIDLVGACILDADWKGVERAAHSLKGGCHNVGAEFLGEVARKIEQAGTEADGAEARFHLRVLQLHFDPCVELLEHELGSVDGLRG